MLPITLHVKPCLLTFARGDFLGVERASVRGVEAGGGHDALAATVRQLLHGEHEHDDAPQQELGQVVPAPRLCHA